MTTELDILLAEHDAEIDALEATIRKLRARDDRPRFVVSHPFEVSVIVAALERFAPNNNDGGIALSMLANAKRVLHELAEWDRANQLRGNRALND